MTLEEVREEKLRLENEIKVMVEDFEKKCDVYVSAVKSIEIVSSDSIYDVNRSKTIYLEILI